MKILWIVQKDLLKDLDISTWIEMSKSLVQRDHQVTLVALSTSNEKYRSLEPNLRIEEIRVVNRFPLVMISFHLQVLIFSLYWLFSIRPDVIITHPITAIFLLMARVMEKLFKLNTKFVLDIRTLPVRNENINDKIKNTLVHLSIWIGKAFFNGLTVITPALKQMISNRFRINPEQIGIWMSGVNIDLFQPKNKESEINPKSHSVFTIMYHGALTENRGLFETIQAMDYVNKISSDVNLFILGKGFAFNQMRDLVDQLNLKKCVHFHDAVTYEEIPNYISKADVGIIPLTDELCWRVSSPLKLLEYLAMAKPVIVSPIEAHTSVLNSCPAAIFLKSTSSKDISVGILEAFNNRNQLPQLGMVGRKLVIENFTWYYQASKLEKFITNL